MMHLHDPLRPKNLHGRPCLLNFLCVIPPITVCFHYDEVKLYCNVPVDSSNHTQKIISKPYDLEEFFIDYMNDPEGILQRYFQMRVGPQEGKEEVKRDRENKVMSSKPKIEDVEF